MGLTYSKVRNFESSNSTQWLCRFGDNGTQFNKIENKYAPVIDFSYQKMILTIQNQYTPLGHVYETPVSLNNVKAINLTFLDTADFGISNEINNYISTLPLNSHRGVNFTSDNHSLDFFIDWMDKEKNILFIDEFKLLPKGSIAALGNQDYGVYSFPMEFIVVDYKRVFLKGE